ncbi:hypothetical protein [Streptococcus suis]
MNKPLSPKQTCRFFVLFYALFSAFFIYSYMVNEPISGSFLLMLPTMQIIKSYKTEEEKRYLYHPSHLFPVYHDLDLFRGHLAGTDQTTCSHPSCWICSGYSLSTVFQNR